LNPLKTRFVLVISNTSRNMTIYLYVKSLHTTEDNAIVGRVAKGNQANNNLLNIKKYHVSPHTALHLYNEVKARVSLKLTVRDDSKCHIWERGVKLRKMRFILPNKQNVCLPLIKLISVYLCSNITKI
jgi:hypothetical protein